MTYTEMTREHLEDCIYPVLAKIQVFAQELGISETTLRKRLRQEGTSWADLSRDEIRRRIIDGCNENLSSVEINNRLGYADPAIMLRVRREVMSKYLTGSPALTR
jgi:AraC-like DNA-binding protein